MSILVTGCAGYIGSHTCVELFAKGYDIVGLDDFSNSKPEVLDRIKQLSGKEIKFYEGNMLDEKILEKIFSENKIEAVIDFAAFKAVGDSVKNPVKYYINNVSSVLVLLTVMQRHEVKKIIFSSTATVYGTPEFIPLTEEAKVGGTESPYATSKYFVERILKDVNISDPEFSAVILRYFNPIGAHPSGLLGEEPNGIPANLMPYIGKVATGELPFLRVFGDDYDTHDGTGVRDYLHVVDLAKAHVSGLKKLEESDGGIYTYNLGTGIGYSVLDIVHGFEKANGIKIPYQVVERRPGDIAEYYSSPAKAEKELGWKAELNLEDMCRDTYKFVLNTRK